MGKYTTSAKSQGVHIRMGDEGISGIEAITQVQAFNRIVSKYPDQPALHQKRLVPVSLHPFAIHTQANIFISLDF